MKQTSVSIFVVVSFSQLIFSHLITFTYMTVTLTLYDNPFWNDFSGHMYSDKVPKSANGNIQNNAGSSLICYLALGRHTWNPLSEEQRWRPALIAG